MDVSGIVITEGSPIGQVPEWGTALGVSTVEGAGLEPTGPLVSTAKASKNVDGHRELSYSERIALAPDWPDDMPDSLRVMKLVELDAPPDTATGRSMAEWLKNDPLHFSQELVKLDTAYLVRKNKEASGVSGESGPCPACAARAPGGEENPARVLIRELLEGL